MWRGDGAWVTVDRWRTEEHYQRFRREWLADYEALDREMELLTERESAIGTFTAV